MLEGAVLFQSSKKVSFSAVRDALSGVPDPALGHGLVSLGAIKDLKIEGDAVSFSAVLANPAEHGALVQQACEEALGKVDGLKRASIQIRAREQKGQQPASASSQPNKPKPQGNRLTMPTVKHLVAVASGKGGVGKSTVAVNLAIGLSKLGARVGILDADLYGPSLPLLMGLTGEQPRQEGDILIPLRKGGIEVMSMGFLVPEDQPVVWRGPMVHTALTQMLTQVQWGELDYLLVDMPPGTGDAQLTLTQGAPLSGAVVVTTPQKVSLIDARKGAAMFQGVNVPVLGIVENMSGFVCESCDHVTPVFSQGGGARLAEELQVPFLGSVPLDPRVAAGGDLGEPILYRAPESPASEAFRAVAAGVRDHFEQTAEPFQPLSLEW